MTSSPCPRWSAVLLLLTLHLVPTAAFGAERIVIRAGRLVNPGDGPIRERVDIVVEGDRILEVGEDLDAAGARVIDLAGMTVLPGLIDSHTHICLTPDAEDPVLRKTAPFRTLEALDNAARSLRAGFTTMRDLDNEGADMADIAVRRAIEERLFVGPRLFVSGWALSITGGHMNVTGLRPSIDRRVDQLAIMADDRDSAVAAIRDQIKAGVDFIKIYATGTLRHVDRETFDTLSQYSEDEIRAMVEETARWGKDVAAHAYGGPGAYNAVAAGVRSIEHGMFLDERTLDLMAERGTFWSPTMTVYLPEADDPPEDVAFRERIVERHRETFVRAMKKGVAIAFGTDAGALPHGEQWRELVRMAEYGMPPMDVLRSATVTGARLLRLQDEIGRIAPGYRADIIGVQGEPDRDIAALREVPFVMVRGTIVVN